MTTMQVEFTRHLQGSANDAGIVVEVTVIAVDAGPGSAVGDPDQARVAVVQPPTGAKRQGGVKAALDAFELELKGTYVWNQYQ